MKSDLKYLIAFAMALAVPYGSAELNDDPGRWLGVGYDLEEKFDPNELKRLVADSKRDYDENSRLMKLILRAALENDQSFRVLLSREDLRADTSVDLALSAYDFMLNKNEGALDHILAHLATEPVGADTNTILIMSVIDEWDRTIKAFRKHFFRTDGAGATCFYGFRQTRQYLYPDDYAKNKEVIEAPIR